MKFALCAVALIFIANPALAESPWASGLSNEPLVAVDDSQVTLSLAEGRLLLEFVSHGGVPQKTAFTFVNDKIGTVSDDSSGGKPTGFFRQTDIGLEIEYDDGHTASLFANVADGLTMTRRGSGGEIVCVSWYPKDHVFSAAERRAAVAAYAQSLGIHEPAASTAFKKKRARTARTESTASVCSPAIHAPAQVADVPMPVVHPIDAKPASPPVATLPVGALPATVKTASALEVLPAGAGASQCLSVEALGTYIGFRDRCGNDVEVIYCLQKGSDPAVACGTGTKLGSVPQEGFTGVFALNTAAEHDVRWVGCSGGPDDVSPELVRADPPAGRCVKKSPR